MRTRQVGCAPMAPPPFLQTSHPGSTWAGDVRGIWRLWAYRLGIVPPPPDLLIRWVVPEIGGPVGGPLTLVQKIINENTLLVLFKTYNFFHFNT